MIFRGYLGRDGEWAGFQREGVEQVASLSPPCIYYLKAAAYNLIQSFRTEVLL